MDTGGGKGKGPAAEPDRGDSACILEKEVHAGGRRLKVCRHVYEPGEDTELLLDAMREAGLGSPLVDVGPGTGIEALAAAEAGLEVVAIDVSWSACLNTLLNAGRSPRIHVVQGDTLRPLRRGACGAAVFNTPYLPVEDGVPGSEAWSGGERGVSQATAFIEEAARAGCPLLIVVTSTAADTEALVEEARRRGYEARVAAARHVFFETIMALVLARRGPGGLIRPSPDPSMKGAGPGGGTGVAPDQSGAGGA